MSNNYPGLNINIEAIAAGLLNLIREHPHGGCLVFGMLPADLMESLDQGLKDKIPDCYHWSDEADSGIVEDGQAIRAEVTHAITCRVLTLASEAGECIV